MLIDYLREPAWRPRWFWLLDNVLILYFLVKTLFGG
jgi:hypothetical protein